MRSTFLDDVARTLYEDCEATLSDHCLIVPNRRAVIFLQQALGRQFTRPIWMPKILPVQDFVREFSEVEFPDPISLVLTLYEVYQDEARKLQPDWDESLDSFYSWGELLLGDFDEVDKYEVAADKLFANLQDLQEIDQFFALEGEDREAVQRLWEAIRGNQADQKKMEERFVRLWQLLGPVYHAFRARLLERGEAYDGMAFRTLAQRLKEDPGALSVAHYHFIGFNALLRTEETMISALLAAGKATVYWDVHPWYFATNRKDPLPAGTEPGKFIREYHRSWKEKGWDSRLIHCPLPTGSEASLPKIRLVGAPLHVGQSRYLGQVLTSYAGKSPAELAKVAVVLADEQLLFPVLQALPNFDAQQQYDGQNPVNVTMGYPLRQTHIFHLLDTILRLFQFRLPMADDDDWAYPFEEAARLLRHPYLQAQFPRGEEILRDMARHSQLLLPGKPLRDKAQADVPAWLARIFDTPERPSHVATGPVDPQPILAHLRAILDGLYQSIPGHQKIEREFLYRLYLGVEVLGRRLAKLPPALGREQLFRLIRKALQNVRVPFEGEPLRGLQIMGFLETRNLDFEEIIILGANEGKLPDTSTGNSYLPYLLRKGFGMPTSEEKDAIYAYHFYRFLQRAQDIHLVYNHQTNEQGAQEESRFLQQIRFFLNGAPLAYRHANVEEHHYEAVAMSRQPRSIRVPMEPRWQAALARRFAGDKALSPSALNIYRRCSLQFYFRYLAEIKEPEELEAVIPADKFGSLVHKVLELAYANLGTDRRLSAEAIRGIATKLEPLLAQAETEIGLDPGFMRHGENRLRREAILTQCRALLEQDARSAPLTIRGLEHSIIHPHTLPAGPVDFRLQGGLDRIDELANAELRIIDYKTGPVENGHVNLKRNHSIEDLFGEDDREKLFQGLTYAWLYLAQHPEAEIRVGFISLKEGVPVFQGILQGKPLRRDSEDMAAYEQGLREFLKRIATSDFVQTENRDSCQSCAYNGICQRD